MFKHPLVVSLIFTAIFCSLYTFVTTFGHESRLKSLEAAMHSAQQPLERNYLIDSLVSINGRLSNEIYRNQLAQDSLIRKLIFYVK